MIRVQRPGPRDAAAIFRCLRSYNLYVLGSEPRLDRDFETDDIITVRNAIVHVDFSEKAWVALFEDEIVGFCCWDWIDPIERIAKTVLISVAGDARQRGAGKMLQQRRLDEMRAHGAREVHTWSDDPKAIAWYEAQFGYVALGTEPIRHAIHCFSFGGGEPTWAIHRGFREQDSLTHLRLRLDTDRAA